MPIEHVVSNVRPSRWRQEIDEENRTIKIVYHPDTYAENLIFTDKTPTTYASQLRFIMMNVEWGNWIFVKKCKAKRFVGR